MRRRLILVVAAAAALWLAPGALAAGWCGTGEAPADLPDVATGQQIHAVVVVPSDGVDNFAAVANKLADDVASMTAWWTSQDPTRAPRFDLATFPGGTCLDISFVRLPVTGASLHGASTAFDRVVSDVENAGFVSSYKDYLVYYDGPSVQASVCGTGNGNFASGPGFAILWLAGCPRVPTDGVAMHELGHALGAVPSGVPHECPAPNGNHVCDSPDDLLYPFASGKPLSALLLDAGHDDYYGLPGGGGLDIRSSVWLRHLDTPQVPLAVAMAAGRGSVAADLPGLDCAAACTTVWDQNTTVQLSAVPADGFRLVRWTGACSADALCTVQLDGPKTVTAVFGPARVSVKATVAGRGTVRCTPACSARFPAGDPVTLRAVPAKGWTFVRWSGACKGTQPVCRPKTDAAVSARATFRRR